MNQRTLRMLLAAMSLAGCAAAPPQAVREPSAAPATVTYRISGAPARFQHATVEGGRIFGPAIELASSGDAYRGQAYGDIVDLHWDGDRLVGRVGTTDDGLSYREDVAGHPMEVVLSPGVVRLPPRERAVVLAMLLRH